MTESSVAIDKLRNIEGLWEKLKTYKTRTPEYSSLIKKIAILSFEYQTLIESAKKAI